MAFLGVEALRAERRAFIELLRSLDAADFDKGETLCEGWAPRDVLAHVLGVDGDPAAYVKALGNVGRANASIVAAAADLSREDLLAKGDRWAEVRSPAVQAVALFLIGDVAVHRLDVARGLGVEVEVSEAAKGAVFREGIVLGPARWRRYRAVPTDGGRGFGFGREVRGTREALGMWLAGRQVYASEIDGLD